MPRQEVRTDQEPTVGPSVPKGGKGGSTATPGDNKGQGQKSLADQVLDHALTFLGIPYVYGGTSRQGIDCSGLVQQVYSKYGIALPRIADAQARVGTPVSAADARPGDLVYFENNSNEPGYDHIGIYIGHGKMIVAPHTGASVQIEDVGTAAGFDRVLPHSAFAGMQNNAGQYVWHPGNGMTIHEAAMSVTGDAKAGTSNGSLPNAPGSGVGDQSLSKQDIRKGLSDLGFAQGLIASNKSLRDAFHKILSEGLDVTTGVGQQQALEILQNTRWFKHHTAAQRTFDDKQFSDKTQAAKDLHDARASIKAEALQEGVALDDDTLDKMAHQMARNGLTPGEVNQLIAKHFHYTGTGTNVGTSGSAVQDIQQLASRYYVPISHQQVQHLTRQVLSGGLDPSSLSERFQQQALSMFSYLKDQLTAGQTIADVVDPYKQMMSNTLELNPNSIKQNDANILGALQYKGEDGSTSLMSLGQFQQHLYSDPRWLYTQNAKQSLVSTTGSILQKMGLIT